MFLIRVIRMKTCTKCRIEKEEGEFGPWKYSKCGLSSWCRNCSSEYQKLVRAKPGAKKSKQVYNKGYGIRNKDRISKQKKEYHARPHPYFPGAARIPREMGSALATNRAP